MGVNVGIEQRPMSFEGGTWVREDSLAHARLVVAVICTIIAYLNPASVGRLGSLGGRLILVYLTYSLINLTVIRIRRYNGSVWVLWLHAAEVLVVSLITISTGGPHSRFLELYIFVFFVAACQWGFNGALLTSCACVAILFADWALVSTWPGQIGHPAAPFITLLALSACVVSSACVLGLLVEGAKKQHIDAAVITRLIRRALPEPSLKTAIGSVLASVREHFDADRVRLAIQEIKGQQAVAWEVTRLTEKLSSPVQFWKLTEYTRQACFAMPPEAIRRHLEDHRGGAIYRARTEASEDPKDGTVGALDPALHGLQIVSEQHTPLGGSWWLLATSFSFEGKWMGRLTVYNPRRKRRDASGDSQFLGTLVREVGPTIYTKYLVGRLRSRAQAMERTRLAQDLHDGVVQSLIALEMQIDVLRRNQAVSAQPSSLLQELGRFQSVLHNEIANVREEMQRVRPLEVESVRLLDRMAWTVNRFRQELGISASFVAESQDVDLPSRVCTELVRIVQEALANVRKHSGAHKVLVRFGRENAHYKLSVEDDGCGFGFTGQLSAAELEASSYCPLIIKERVHAIGGELVIQSSAGSGARLEILVPLTHNG